MWTLTFWKDTTERCVGTSCQVYIALIGTNQAADYLNRPKIQWDMIFMTMGIAASVCLAKCLVASTRGDPTNASFIKPREP